MPLAEGTTIVAELAAAGSGEALGSKTIDPNAPRTEDEAEFCLTGLKAGSYELRTILRDGKGTEKIQRVQFSYPFDPLEPVPSPQSYLVGPLRSAVTAPAYKLDVGPVVVST